VLIAARGPWPDGVILLKGGALLALGLVKPWERHLDDVDVWVRPAQVRRAWDSLLSAGFTPVSDSPSTTHHGVDSLDAPTHQLPMLRSPNGALLELHLESHADGDAGDFDACWAAGRDVDVFGTKVRVPSLPHLLEQLCAHVVRHHFGDLRYWPRHVDDVNAILRVAPQLAAWRDRPDEVGLSLRVAHGRAAPHSADALLAPLFIDPGRGTRAAWQAAATAVRAGRFAGRGPRGLVDAIVPAAAHLRFTGDLVEGQPLMNAHLRRWRRLARRSLRALRAR
jgi:hypothetical protein